MNRLASHRSWPMAFLLFLAAVPAAGLSNRPEPPPPMTGGTGAAGITAGPAETADGSGATRIFTCAVNQPFAGSQSPDAARIAAVAKGKTEALERAGTYLESLTVVENFALTKDQTIALASGILSVAILSQKNYATEDGFGIILEMKIEVDTRVMKRRIEQVHEDQALLEKYVELKDRERELLDRVNALENQNRELAGLSGRGRQEKRNELKEAFDEVIKAIPAVEWNQKAIALWEGGRFQDPQRAIAFLTESIELDSKNAVSYNNRGVAYYNLGQLERAIADFDQALRLDADYVDACNNRGVAFFEFKQYQKAIDDFSRAIRLNPQRADSFLNRAASFKNLWQYRSWLDDLNQALVLNPDSATQDRQGSATVDLDEIKRLCENARKACEKGLCRSKKFLDERGFCR